MRVLTRFAAAAVAALSIGAATSANAAQFINFSPPAGDGSISGTFGFDGDAPNLPAGAFTNIFTFMWPADGITTGTISSSFTSTSTDLDFSSVTLNGIEFTPLVGGPGLPEFRLIMPAQMTFVGLQTLIVKGTAPASGLGSTTSSATYAGTLAFTPTAAVPETGTWALMIMGFGGAGAMIRMRRRALTA